MPTLSVCKPEVVGLLEGVKAKYHTPLVEAGVTVGLLAAWPNEGEEHPLKLHGYPCAAVVKVTPYKHRVLGIADAVITLDGPTWEGHTAAERAAILDHELHHLEVAYDGEGNLKSDDHGRPKLRMRLHDVQIGGFEAIAARHGPAALEVQAFRNAHAEYYQAFFSWADDMAEPAPQAGVGRTRKALRGGRPAAEVSP